MADDVIETRKLYLTSVSIVFSYIHTSNELYLLLGYIPYLGLKIKALNIVCFVYMYVCEGIGSILEENKWFLVAIIMQLCFIVSISRRYIKTYLLCFVSESDKEIFIAHYWDWNMI
jgi:hypothetical protein